VPRYCIPMDSSRPVTKAEEDFFSRVGTGNGKKIYTVGDCNSDLQSL
jgi:hypothetical protein